MNPLQILQIIVALATILTGLFALLRPRAVQGFTGLRAEGGRGITEIRAVLGGFFIALGLAPLLLNQPAAYRMLGIAYVGVAAVRAVSIVLDRAELRLSRKRERSISSGFRARTPTIASRKRKSGHCSRSKSSDWSSGRMAIARTRSAVHSDSSTRSS